MEISADAKFTENELGHFLECVETGQHPLTEERSEAWQESERVQEMLIRLEALEEVCEQMQVLL